MEKAIGEIKTTWSKIDVVGTVLQKSNIGHFGKDNQYISLILVDENTDAKIKLAIFGNDLVAKVNEVEVSNLINIVLSLIFILLFSVHEFWLLL